MDGWKLGEILILPIVLTGTNLTKKLWPWLREGPRALGFALIVGLLLGVLAEFLNGVPDTWEGYVVAVVKGISYGLAAAKIYDEGKNKEQ